MNAIFEAMESRFLFYSNRTCIPNLALSSRQLAVVLSVSARERHFYRLELLLAFCRSATEFVLRMLRNLEL